MNDATTWTLATAGTGTATGLLSISPPVLFFFLGVIAVLVRSNIAIPTAATKLLSLYLSWAIGFKAGSSLPPAGSPLTRSNPPVNCEITEPPTD